MTQPSKGQGRGRNEALPDLGAGSLPQVPGEFRAALLERLGPLAERSPRIWHVWDAIAKAKDTPLHKVVDRPVDNTGATLLTLALTDSSSLSLTRDGLTKAECIELARLLVQLGADPFRRARNGDMPVLSSGFVKDEILAKTVLLSYPERFPREVSRSERLWLYVGYCSSTPNTHLSPLLMRTLFPPDGSRDDDNRRASSSGLSITSLLQYQGREDRPFAVNDGALLCVLYELRRMGIMSGEEVITPLNETFDTNGLLLAHRLAMISGSKDPFSMLIELGGLLSLVSPSSQSGIGRGGTAVHMAARYGTVEQLTSYLPFLPYPFGSRDQEGNTPLMVYLIDGPPEPHIETLLDLLGERCEGLVTNKDGQSAFDLVARRGAYEALLPALRGDLIPPETWGVFSRQERAVLRALLETLREGDKTITSSFRGTLVSFLKGDALQTELTRMVPKILTAPHPGMIGLLGFAYDIGPVQQPSLLKRLFSPASTSISPNAAELLALLAHPAFDDLSKPEHAAALNELVRGITSLERFFHRGVRRVNKEVVSLWREVGKLGFEFLNFKFDARSYTSPNEGTTSLLEQFGFVRTELSMNSTTGIPGGLLGERRGRFSFLLRVDGNREIEATRAVRTTEGVRHVVETVPEGTEIELCQTHLRIYHPSLGELIVRNSSPEGGRTALLEPVYVMTAQRRARLKLGSGLKILRSYDEIERTYTSLLEPSLYIGGRLSADGSTQASELAKIFRTFQRAYRAWLFDNDAASAYVEDPSSGKRYSVGGIRSPGFPSLLDALESWSRVWETRELAFCRPAFPAWGAYVHIAAQPDVLSELRRLSRQDFGSATLRSSGVFDFIQAGMNSFGDLIVR